VGTLASPPQEGEGARATARDRPHKRELQPLHKGDRKGSPLLYYAWPFVEKWLLEPHRVE